jgi:hypothetical protein
MTQQFLLKFPTTKFHEDPLSGCSAVTRDTNQHHRLSQTQQQLFSSHTRIYSGKQRAQKWLSKTKSADMCRKKRAITGRLDNNEHSVK